MGAITVRNLPPELARVIRQKAKREKASLNRTVINLLEKATGLGKPRTEELHTDLDRFFGCISKAEADELDEAIREQRQIEPEMWK
jgi:plasmid stability protein